MSIYLYLAMAAAGFVLGYSLRAAVEHEPYARRFCLLAVAVLLLILEASR